MKIELTAILFCLPILLFGQTEDSLTHQELNEVNIHHSESAEITFEDDEFYIVDFMVSDRGTYLLLKHQGRYELCQITTPGKSYSLPLDFDAESLFQDCLGFFHVLGKDSMYQVENSIQGPYIHERNSIDLYHSFFKDCVVSTDKHLILRKYANFDQLLTYFIFDRETQKLQKLYEINDQEFIESTTEEDYEIKALWARAQATQDIHLFRLWFQKKTFFDNVITQAANHPLFLMNDSIYIFDHFKEEVVVLNSAGDELERYMMDHQKPGNWLKHVIPDYGRSNFHSDYQKKGRKELRKLSNENYQLTAWAKSLECTPYSKMIVYNGFAYFTKKQSNEDNLNKFYRQKL